MKRYLKLLIVLCLFVITTGCGYTREERIRMKNIKELGEKNAISYIENKYNFVPEVLDIIIEKDNDGSVFDTSPPPSGDITARLKYKGKEFSVFISGEAKTIDGIDDYQYIEIKKGVVNLLNNKIGYNVKNIHIFYGQDRMISKYYNGSNLNEIMDDISFNIIAEYIDISNYKNIDISIGDEYPKVLFELLNFKDEKSYNSFKNTVKFTSYGISDNDFYNYFIYLNDAWKICKENNYADYIQIPIIKKDNISYYVEDSSRNIVNLSFETTTDINTEEFNKANKYYNYKILFNTYLIKGFNSDIKYNTVHFYAPKIEEYDYKKMQIGIECYNSNISEKDFRVYDIKDIGEYYAGEAYLSTCDYGKEVKIALLYNSRD